MNFRRKKQKKINKMEVLSSRALTLSDTTQNKPIKIQIGRMN